MHGFRLGRLDCYTGERCCIFDDSLQKSFFDYDWILNLVNVLQHLDFRVCSFIPMVASCLACASYVAMIWATDCEMLGFCLSEFMLANMPSVLNTDF